MIVTAVLCNAWLVFRQHVCKDPCVDALEESPTVTELFCIRRQVSDGILGAILSAVI